MLDKTFISQREEKTKLLRDVWDNAENETRKYYRSNFPYDPEILKELHKKERAARDAWLNYLNESTCIIFSQPEMIDMFNSFNMFFSTPPQVSTESYPTNIKTQTNLPIKRVRRRSISKSTRYDIFRRDKFRCRLCGVSGSDHDVVLEIDHKIPVAKGGTNDIKNLWTLCNKCNRGKSAKDL